LLVKIPRKPDALEFLIAGGKWDSGSTLVRDNVGEHETWYNDSAYFSRTTRFFMQIMSDSSIYPSREAV